MAQNKSRRLLWAVCLAALAVFAAAMVWLPAGTFLYDVLYYTTADGEEVRREVYLDKNGSMITLDGEILADSIRLAAH